jgi:hypothetical protein
MAGIVYGWIGVYYGQMAQMVDTWAYHYESIQEYHLLISDPAEFVASLFRSNYENGYTNFLQSHNSWWNDLKANFLIKIMAIWNVFSFAHYYINLIFYSFITLFGPIAIYRVMKDIFPRRKIPVLIATFLIPSFIYWTSGLHKEGLIFTGLGLICYHLYFGFKEKHFSLQRVLLIILGFLLVLIFRNFLILPLLTAVIAWVASEKLKHKLKPIKVYGVIYLAALLIFFCGKFIHPRLDFLDAVAVKQKEFMNLGGGSAIQVDSLEPTISSFIVNAPQAFLLSTIRPFPSDVHHLLSLAAAAEINTVLLLFVIFLFWRRNGIPMNTFLLFCLFFSFSVLMMIGYSVNVLGAIVRYRSIVIPFLIVPLMARIDWDKVGTITLGNMSNKNNV